MRLKHWFMGLVLSFVLCSGLAYGATLDKTNGDAGIPWSGVQKTYVLSNTVDLAAVATGDVLQVIDVKAKTFVFDVFVEIVTPAGSATAATATVGDGATANGWDAETNLQAAAATVTHGASGTDSFATSGKYYSAADTIDLTCTVTTGPISAGKIKVFAVCADLN